MCVVTVLIVGIDGVVILSCCRVVVVVVVVVIVIVVVVALAVVAAAVAVVGDDGWSLWRWHCCYSCFHGSLSVPKQLNVASLCCCSYCHFKRLHF